MSDVTYFQRYSQAENHATNNTLLILRYFYQAAPYKLQGVLNSLLGEQNIRIGLTFKQQEKTRHNVIDGLIQQEPFAIYIEAKMGGEFDLAQMKSHIESIKAKKPGLDEPTLLLGLTKETISEPQRDAVLKYTENSPVRFAAVTFTQILGALEDNCAQHEAELIGIVADYEKFLIDSNLREARNRWMIVLTAGVSKKENVHYSLYYDDAVRPYLRGYGFFGLYDQKTISHVGAIVAVVEVSFEAGAPKFKELDGKIYEEERNRILEVIEKTAYYDLKAKPHRFYLVDEFAETHFVKESKGSLWRAKSFDLEKCMEAYDPKHTYTSREIANALHGKFWK